MFVIGSVLLKSLVFALSVPYRVGGAFRGATLYHRALMPAYMRRGVSTLSLMGERQGAPRGWRAVKLCDTVFRRNTFYGLLTLIWF